MRLSINYKNVNDQVYNIRKAKRLLETQKNRVNRIYEYLPGTWQGITADEFRNKLEEFIQELDKAIDDMERLAQDITTVANNIKTTDEQLANDVPFIGRGGFGGGAGGGGAR